MILIQSTICDDCIITSEKDQHNPWQLNSWDEFQIVTGLIATILSKMNLHQLRIQTETWAHLILEPK